ncbi:hypothetical protein PMIN06_012641 [Paraphaeosphaeria minitans]
MQSHSSSLYQPSQSGQVDFFKAFEALGAAILGARTSVDKPRSRSTTLRHEMYLKRPSLKLPWLFAHRERLGFIGTPDAHTYRYTDGSRQGKWSPVLWEDGRYFNAD